MMLTYVNFEWVTFVIKGNNSSNLIAPRKYMSALEIAWGMARTCQCTQRVIIIYQLEIMVR
jgi:hypothetical protein